MERLLVGIGGDGSGVVKEGAMTGQFEHMSIEDLQLREQELEDRIMEVAVKIAELVGRDVPRYLEREARRRWLGEGAFATSMDDGRLKALKGELGELGKALNAEIRGDLADAALWLAGARAENHKSLEANGAVWAALQKIACKLSGLLARFDFPADAEAPAGITYDLVYKTPAYFIDREYCPSHIEAYWRLAEERAQIVEARAALEVEQSRKTLEARWGRF